MSLLQHTAQTKGRTAAATVGSETLTQGLLTKEDVLALNTSPPACIIECYRDAIVHYAWATARNYQQEMVATSRHKKGPQWRSIILIQK